MKKFNLIYKRVDFLDNLRLFLVFCVIVFHSSMTYGPLGSYYFYDRLAVNDPVVKYPLSFFVVFFKSFLMGLFFLISGYFTPASLDKKGGRKFLISKIYKLGFPLLFFSATIYPLLDFYFYYHVKNASIQQILNLYFTHPDPAHLWYIGLLLVFSIIYFIFRKNLNLLFLILAKIPKIITATCFIFLLFIASFIIRIWFPVGYNPNYLRIPIAYLPQIILFYISGIAIYRNRWLDFLSTRNIKIYGIIIFLLLVTLFLLYIFVTRFEKSLTPLSGGWNTYSLIYTFWETLFSIFISLFLLSLFRLKFDSPIKMSSDSFGIYIVHIPILIYFQLILLKIPIHHLFKFIISVILTFIFSEILIRNIKKIRKI
jgi:hypothetical protein